MPVSLSSVAIKGPSGEVIRHRAVLFDMTLARQQDLRTRIAAVTFTGSSEVGMRLVRLFGEGRWPRPC